jgi:thiol:disulfide interchange protein DsbD
MKKIFFVALILVILAIGISANFAAESLNNTTDLNKALDDAKSQNKNVMLIFDQEGCYYCDLLKKDPLSNSDLISKLNGGYVTVIVDVNQQPQLAAEYQVFGTPVIVFMNPSQKEIGRIEGYVGADEFLDYIKGM